MSEKKYKIKMNKGKKMALTIVGGTKKVLYENDLQTYDDLKSVLDMLVNNNLFFFPKGAYVIATKYSQEELLKAMKELKIAGTLDHLIDSMFDSSIIKESDILLWKNEQICKLMTGEKTNYDSNKKLILIEPKLKFDDNFAFSLLEKLYKNLCKNPKAKYDFEAISLFWRKNFYIYFDKEYDPELQLDFTLDSVLESFPKYYENDYIKRVGDVLGYFILMRDEKYKSFQKKNIPTPVLENIARSFTTFDENLNDEIHIKRYKYILNELVYERNSEYGYCTLGYLYYCGSTFCPVNFKKAEEVFLTYLNQFGFNPNICNTLGYIYYYGRHNNGNPDYNLALKYFQMASIVGNVEATYKIGDMYFHGYGVNQNKEAAYQCYENLLSKELEQFYDNTKDNCLGDVALRVGRYHFEEDKNYLLALKYDLMALYALKLRNGMYDNGLMIKLEQSIRLIYRKFNDKATSGIKVYGILNDIDANNVKVVSLSPVVLRFTGKRKRLVVDMKGYNASYTDTLDVEFSGKLLKCTKNEFYLMKMHNDENDNYVLMDENGTKIIISAGDFKIHHDQELLNLTPNSKLTYQCALCQYTKGEGKTYTFHAPYDITNELDMDWIVVETGQQVYPVKYVELAEDELPCSVDKLKHIARLEK